MSRAIREAALGFTRTGGLIISSIGVISVSYLIMILFLLIESNLDQALQEIRSRAEVVIYLKEIPQEEAQRQYITALKSLSWVSNVSYVSKEEALKNLSKTLKGDELLLESLADNPLPPSFRLQFTVTTGIEEYVKELEEKLTKIVPIAEELKYSMELLKPLEKLHGAFQYAVLIIGLIISLSVIFVISNTIRLTLIARQEEIDIMTLVGATRGFIRKPFVIEGMMQGLLSCLIALGVAYGIYEISKQYLPQIHFLLLEEIGLVIMIGWALGGLGSMISLGRFFKH